MRKMMIDRLRSLLLIPRNPPLNQKRSLTTSLRGIIIGLIEEVVILTRKSLRLEIEKMIKEVRVREFRKRQSSNFSSTILTQQ
jgi:hypothetical protein